MMEWEHTRRLALTDDHLLPLINVVFLLLIFFMLVGAIAVPERLDVLPPSSVSAFQPNDVGLELVIDQKGDVLVDDEIVTMERLVSRLSGENAPDRVRLKADANLSATGVLDVLDILRDAGVAHVQLVTVAKR
ncbi:biopolymer transporter ExbD [uncultured Abyssibacter sp.]|uniref:ExbD/TolR family protein n=1 Tax=uncultured Abyssibacter sp. TaxID=2320202 RepID=UPI0032B18C2A